MQIGEVAQRTETSIDTIRFYEKSGLIPKPERTDSGYRKYTEETIRRVQFIKRSQELGFSLKEIADLLSLRVDPKTTCRDVKKRSEVKIYDIEKKIRTLQKIKRALSRVAATCKGKGPTSECPILEVLEGNEKK